MAPRVRWASSPPARRRGSRLLAPIAIAALTATLYGANLRGWRTLGAHEALAAVPARAMSEGNGRLDGGWLIPDFGGIPRVKKPPLGYWLIAATNLATGRADAFAARLPSAVSAALLCGLIGWWGSRWYGRRAGLAAAFVQATSLWALTYGRKAEVDVTLCLLTAAALALALTGSPTEAAGRRRWRWAGVWTLAGIGWLGKFHFVPTLIFAPLAVHLILARRQGNGAFALSPIGIAAFVVLAAPWTLWMALSVPAATDAWIMQTAGRVGGALGARSLAFYPAELLLLTLPWTPCWLWALSKTLPRHGRVAIDGWTKCRGNRVDRRLRAAWRTIVGRNVAGRSAAAGRRFDRDLFPAVWLGTTIVVLSLSLGRHRHYLLPALPACSLLAGRALSVALTLATNGRTFGGRLRGRRAAALTWSLPTVGALLFATAAFTLAPRWDDRRATNAAFLRSLPERLPEGLPDGEPILVLGMGESSALWHLPPKTGRSEDAAGLADALRQRGRCATLVDDRSAWRIDECGDAWRRAGGTFTVTWLAREGGADRSRPNAFERLDGLRFAWIEATPPQDSIELRTAAAGGIIRR